MLCKSARDTVALGNSLHWILVNVEYCCAVCVVSSQRYDHREDLRRHDDHGLLQAEQSQEAPAAAGGSGPWAV